MEVVVSRVSKLKCPQCGRQGAWLELPTFPFCSDRCRKLDLYKWFSEEHVISSQLYGEKDDITQSIDELNSDKQ